ncbi:MAG: hypothetical protein GF331_05725 [Chitinivibrionales bacterium]|nr:hypothetical protein [Chitinivibrionales bacterium]
MSEKAPQIRIYERPDNAPTSADYMVTVNGTPVHVYDCEVAAYACWAFEGQIEVRVAVRENHEDIVVRPWRLSQGVTWDGSVAVLTLDKPTQLCLDPPFQQRKPLFIYANALETDRPNPSDPAVHFFEAGKIHDAGEITLRSGETLYIEGGAVVRGTVEVMDAEGVRIAGHGILDGGGQRLGRRRLVYFGKCRDVAINGIIMVGTPSWTIVLHRCRDCRISDVKQIGWLVGSDGVDVVASHDVLIENCCLRNNDDCVVVKAFGGYQKNVISPEEPAPAPPTAENIEVRNCILYNAHAGNALEIGFELRSDVVRNVHFHDCDVIGAHGEGGVFTIHNGDHATVEHVLYERIRVEHYYDRFIDLRVLYSRYSRDEQRGRIRDVVFRDIDAAPNTCNSVSLIGGWDSEHLVEDIRLENVRIGGKRVASADDLHLFSNEHVRNVSFC